MESSVVFIFIFCDVVFYVISYRGSLWIFFFLVLIENFSLGIFLFQVRVLIRLPSIIYGFFKMFFPFFRKPFLRLKLSDYLKYSINF